MTIDNQTNFPIVVQNASTSKSTTTPSLSGVDIIDQAYGTPIQTLRVYEPNNTITVGAPLDIPLAAIQAGSLTAPQAVAFADATTTGDIVYTYSNGQVSGVQVAPTVQVFVSATGVLTTNATGSITIQSTSQAITLGQVTSGGAVNITAPASILSSGSGTQIKTSRRHRPGRWPPVLWGHRAPTSRSASAGSSASIRRRETPTSMATII